jgi:hypothetical protein
VSHCVLQPSHANPFYTHRRSTLVSTMAKQLILDGVGWTYMVLFILWNLALAGGMTFLWIHRFQPSLRMRRIPLLLTGVFALHVYGVLCLIAYPIAQYVSCNFEFWLMSIWLPFGIALFHAANSQFLHLASRQKQFARMSSLKDHKAINEEKAEAIASSRLKRIFAGLERADNINQTLILIGIGMAVEVSSANTTRVYSLTNIPCSFYSLFLSISDPGSSIPAMDSSITQSKALGWRYA